MKYKVIIRGIIKIISPKIYNRLKKKGTGGTDSARYCYSVWLRHLIFLYRKGGMIEHPKTVAEFGPGDSLGIGFNALITGSDQLLAFDIIKHSNISSNLRVFDELVELYKKRISIPNDASLLKVKPKLNDYSFPKDILSDNYLKKMLDENRIKKIRKTIVDGRSNDFTIKYIVPWNKESFVKKESVDLIYSQAVMEHIDNVQDVYKVMYQWLRKGGYMSHQIDYSAHETHRKWYGHWTYPNYLWKIILNGRLYSINRYPHSYHVHSMINQGFNVIFQLPFLNKKAKSIRKEIRQNFIDEDLNISSGYIIAKKDIE